MNIAFTKKSSNAKVGSIPVTTTSKDSCPPECPLLANGCYASAGFHTNLHWNKVTKGERGDTLEALCSTIAALKPGTLWRHNVAGDLLGTDGYIDGPALWKLANANSGKRGFTYTHYSPDKGDNLSYIEGANRIGFTVNISTNSVEEAKAMLRRTSAPVVTIVPGDFWGENKSVDGVVRCPAEYRDEVTCASCQLCQRSNRTTIVGFTVHGTQAKQAEVIARG